MTEELLRIEGLTKRFGPTVALEDVSLSFSKGTGVAVVGENGAGKSTLMKVLAGVHQPDEGRMWLRGEPFAPHRPADATHAGIVTVYQEPVFLPALTVTENLFAGRELRSRSGGLRWEQMRGEAASLVTRFGLPADIVAHEMQELTVAQQQLTLIARAFHHDADLLILDEPTSALSDIEADRLFESVREWQEGGGGVVYITHRLRELPEVCGHIAVLRDGRLVGEHEIGSDFEPTRVAVVDEMSRRDDAGPSVEESEQRSATRGRSDRPPRLEVRGLTRTGEFEDVSFALRPGEVRGLYGLVGAGRTEVALTIYAERHAEAGEVLLEGEPVAFRGPREAKRQGIMYLPEDRGRDGLYRYLSVRANLSSAVLERLRRLWRVIDFRRERELTQQSIDELSIRTHSPEANILTLSGGSQQKVLLARALSVEPSVLLLDEPTRGVDVGTKREFYERIRQLATDGLAVLVISSELHDLLEVADVIDVMREGHIVESFELADGDMSTGIVRAAIGAEDRTATPATGGAEAEEM